MNTPSPKPTDNKPLPCPFCGAILVKAHGMKYWVHSPGDPCLLGRWTVGDESVEAWNRRAPALAPFEKLVEEWRSTTDAPAGDSYITQTKHECADRLSAVVEEVRGK